MASFDMPDYWSDAEERLFADAIRSVESLDASLAREMANDEWFQFLHHEAIFDWELRADYRADTYTAFEDYLRDTYGIDDWDDYFDWQGFRDAYERAG